MMENELLLTNSYIFDESTLLDRSNQSVVDLKQNPEEETVKIFLDEEALPHLEKKLSISVAENIFLLIMTCFDLYPDFVLPTFDKIFQKSQLNSNFIILTTSIISKFDFLRDKESHKDVITFIDNSLNQLLPQIKNKDQNSFQLYGHTISNHFITRLMADLLLSTTLSKELIENFYAYLFSNNITQDTKISIQLIKNALKSGLSSNLPHEAINFICSQKIDFGLQIEDIKSFLPKMTPKNFKLILPIIEPSIIKSASNLNKEFIIDFLEKSRISKAKIKSAGELIPQLSKDQISIEIWNYLRNIRFKLPYDYLINLIGTLDTNYIVKLIPSLEICEKPPFDKLILECDDFKSYDNLFFYKEVNKYSHILKQDFWTHIVKLSTTKKCLNSTAFKLAALLKNSGDEKVIKNTFKEMLFSVMPLNKNNINFMSKLSSKLKMMKIDLFDEFLTNEVLTFYQNKNILPIPLFWKLTPKKILNKMMHQNPSPFLLYGYEFAEENDKFIYLSKLKEITILDQDEESMNQVLNFIQSKSLNSIVNVNEKALSLIIASLSFSKSITKLSVNGITKENVLLFLSTILKFSKKSGNKKLLDEITPLICTAYDIADRNTKYFKGSVEFILSFYMNSSYKINSIYSLMNNLTSLMVYDIFNDDKNVLLASIFKLSNSEFNSQEFFKNYGGFLVDHMIKNASNIVKNKELLNQKSLCLTHFDIKEMENKFIEALTTTKETEKVIDIIKLIENFFNRKLNLKFNDTSFLSKCIDHSIDNKNYDDVVLIHKFIGDQKLNDSFSVYRPEFPIEIRIQVLPNKTNLSDSDVDQLISLILNDPSPEKNKVLFEGLFRFMMCEESTAINYFKSILSKNEDGNNESISKTNLMILYDSNRSDEFINALNDSYVYSKSTSKFVRKAECKETSISDSKFGLLIISKLFDSIQENQNNYKAFYALKYIASSFPFLFSQNPQKVIDIVLPVLNENVQLFLNLQDCDSNEIKIEDEIKLKTLISALSFLYSSLCSVKVLDAFFDWFFTNLSTLSETTILAFVSVLCSLDVKNEQKFLYPFIKYNLFENVQTLLRRNNQYLTDRVLYLLTNFYISMTKAPECFKLTTECSQNPVLHAFNHKMTQIKFNFTNKSYLFFIKKLKNSYSYMKEITKAIVKKTSTQLTQSNFESLIIEKVEQGEISKTQVETSNNEENENKWNEFKSSILQLLLNHCYYCTSLFVFDKDYSNLNSRLNLIIESFDFFIASEFSPYNNKYSLVVINLINLVMKISKMTITNEETITLFSECLNKLLNTVCLPEFRNNSKIIRLSADLFLSLEDDQVPIRTTLLICFILCHIKKDNSIKKESALFIDSLKLSSKIKYTNLGNVIPILENIFDDAICNLDFEIINTFFAYLPDITKSRGAEIFRIINGLFTIIKDSDETKLEDLQSLSSIVKIVAPRRDTYDSTKITDSVMYEQDEKIYEHKNVLRPIPSYLIDTVPFWKLLDHHYDTLGRIYLEISENKKNYKKDFYDYFSFLLDYPEIVDLSTRIQHFRKHILEERIRRRRIITVERSNIIESSYQQLKDLEDKDLRGKISIVFKGEKGTDAGGPFNEWLTNLVHELLNPKNKLFESTDTDSIYPSRNAKEDQLKYLNFAGKMIAVALINGVQVEAHFAPFFFKTILNRKLGLKDIKTYSNEIYNSYQSMLCNNVKDIGYSYVAGFSDENGQYKEVELVEGGDKIEVTNENKNDFINKQYRFYIIDSIKKQSEAFCEGFSSIVPHKFIRFFSQGELEFLICGLPVIDIDDMERNIILSGYSKDDLTIQLFFNEIRNWNDEMKAGLLQFITGNTLVPLNGFVDRKITISRGGDIEHLPQARTCSKSIDLPPYSDKKSMHEKLVQAVTECKTFEFI